MSRLIPRPTPTSQRTPVIPAKPTTASITDTPANSTATLTTEAAPTITPITEATPTTANITTSAAPVTSPADPNTPTIVPTATHKNRNLAINHKKTSLLIVIVTAVIIFSIATFLVIFDKH